MRKTTLLFIGALIAAAPASAQNREHLQMAAELTILRAQNQELANTLAETIKLLNETAKALNSRIDQTNEAMRKGFADQSLTINTAAGDVRKTLAQTQDAATRLGELKEEVQALRTSIPALLSRLTPADGGVLADPGAVSAAGDAGALPVASPPPSTLGLSPDRMYNTAFSDYAGGNYAAAIQGFEEFLKAFPTSPRADDAQQYIGEAEFIQSRFEQAIAAFSKVIQNYPKENQVPWAYYKRGLAQSRLGQTAAARASFESAVKQFPDTEPGVLSLSRLQGLDSAAAPATPLRKP
ncbi:MAG: tetratricopeptide repeat protein [Vicinamibacterales bacterium]